VATELVAIGDARLEVVRIAAVHPALPAVVWLHEGLGSVSLWRDFPARVASATGAPAVLYSRRGYGRSTPRAAAYGPDYLHQEAREVLPALLDRLGVRAPVLVGHSDGASIALIYAGSSLPAAGVVAMAPHVSVEEKALAGIRATCAAFAAGELRRRLARHHADVEHAFRGWSEVWLDPEFAQWSIEGLLPAITAPLLVVQGEDDEYATGAQVEAIARAARAPCDVHLLPHCGHSPHRARPARTLELVARFVLACARGEA